MLSLTHEKNTLFDDLLSVSTTPIVLAFLAEHSTGTLSEITRAVYSVSKKLEGTRIRINAIFRGNFKPSSTDIWSETVNDEIWYWLSNNFIEHCNEPEEKDFRYKARKSLDDYTIENLGKNLNEINWPSAEDKNAFVEAIQGVISSARGR